MSWFGTVLSIIQVIVQFCKLMFLLCVFFLKKKEFIGKITNYNAFLEIQTYWMPEIGVGDGQYCQESE